MRDKSPPTVAQDRACCKAGSSSPFALGYIGLLFVVASYGDRTRRFGREGRSRLLIYPLSLAIYCTSWTFFGSVGLASRTGFDFLTIYIGPILMIGLCWPLIMRIVRLAKAQNITSIADFIAARYGKAPDGRRHRGADRDHRHDSLYRAAAQSGVVLARAPSWRTSDQPAGRSSRCWATSRCSSRSRWRPSRCCSAPVTSTPPSTRTA